MIKTKLIRLTLTTKEPFRIGGPEDPIRGQDNPVAIVGEEVVIPGPSLKGAYRAELEKYFIDTYFDKTSNSWKNGKESCKPCIPAPKLSNDEKNLVVSGMYKDQGCHYPCDPRGFKCGDKKHTICPVCYLLGANGLNGFIRVPFLRPKKDVIASELYSAKMDRSTGTVTQGTNRPYSIVPVGTAFEGELTVIINNDILHWELGKARKLGELTEGDKWLKDYKWDQEKFIKELVIDRLTNIEIMGGYKSKGCGKVEISVID